MREIIFRGKREDNGAWVYGSFIPDLLEVHHGGPDGWLGDWGFIKPFEKDENGRHAMVYVQRNTVGQYTGLTDKNGKKIFEGDIVKYGDTVHLAVFEQRNGTAYFGMVYSPQETLPFGHYQDLRQIEVIGNRWDNPELLEEVTTSC